ncbi:MAG: DUF5666 domain-containing protein [Candidatus Moraniibacteriota bacterium]
MESEPTPKPISSPEKSMGSPVTSVSRRLTRERIFVLAAVVIGVVLVAVASFAVGFSAGLHKARFSYRFGENYERNFVKGRPGDMPMMDQGMLRRMDGDLFRSGHGVTGVILSLADRTMTLRNPAGQESSVAVTDATIYNKGSDRVNFEDLSVGDMVVALGKPSDDGTVVAALIRVFDPQVEAGRPGVPFPKGTR